MSKLFNRFANIVSEATGSPFAFIICMVLVIVWALSGPLFGFSDTWQLVINTSTTIITFLMVFLIQNTQNRDNGAIQAKLDELIRAVAGADNEYIGIEHLTDQELKAILEEVEKNAHRLQEERRRRAKGGKAKPGTGKDEPNEPKIAESKPRAKSRTRTRAKEKV
ncbi:MAG TPA: low affinity iron permease family protein [Hyphomonadaceae bacterium]|nr:low affinity iron permease family protein [Hyphomonadaceae bacterium]